MNKFLLLLAVALVSNMASANSYAPKVNDIVVVYDMEENQFSPLLYQSILGEIFELKMDTSCSSVQIDAQHQVLCVSANASVIVGKLAEKIDQQDFESVYAVQWYSNVEIKEVVLQRRLMYSLVVK